MSSSDVERPLFKVSFVRGLYESGVTTRGVRLCGGGLLARIYPKGDRERYSRPCGVGNRHPVRDPQLLAKWRRGLGL